MNYRTSSSQYGSRVKRNVTPSKELKKVYDKPHLDDDERRYNQYKWQAMSKEYGGFGFKQEKLGKALDELQSVQRAKIVLPPENQEQEASTAQHITVKYDVEDYKVVPKEEHQIYTLSSNVIGAKKPAFGTTVHPHNNKFTKTFRGGAQRDSSLNTTITTNRYY